MLPEASFTRKPTARDSSNTVCDDRPDDSSTCARYQTHRSLWSGETSSESTGSTVPVTRTSPAAIEAIGELSIPPIRWARR